MHVIATVYDTAVLSSACLPPSASSNCSTKGQNYVTELMQQLSISAYGVA